MDKILITGATGNVGIEVINHLSQRKGNFKFIAGVRGRDTKPVFLQELKVPTIHFDFEDEESFENALNGCTVLFLLRPPQLADVKKYFRPLIEMAKDNLVKHIVFLSVQGVENSSLIPHRKIENLIRESGIPYTFLRPAYFMQNFTTTLRRDIIEKNIIYLPAGKAKFTLIALEDVGAVAAEVLASPKSHLNKAYDLTNEEQLNFEEMAARLSLGLNRKIQYLSPNLLSFYFHKRREKISSMYILVMIMLHYFPRFSPIPTISGWVEKITGKTPLKFSEFVDKNQHLMESDQ